MEVDLTSHQPDHLVGVEDGEVQPVEEQVSQQTQRLSADALPPPRGPLTVIGRNLSSSVRLHLLDTDRKAVGCGWRPSLEQLQIVSQEDYQADPMAYSKCTRCFRFYDLPAGWELFESAPVTRTDTSSSSGSDSLTDESVDTASEIEGISGPSLLALM